MPPPTPPITATVIIPTFDFARWGLLCDSVASVQAQSRPPIELIICVDHNPELKRQCEEQWNTNRSDSDFPVLIVANRFEQHDQGTAAYQKAHGSKRRFGAGWSRNTAAELARGDILVFLDDDASAEPDWLEYLLAPFDDYRTVAVGGAPLPRYETERPKWFPANFDWIFGCAYRGLPTELAPTPRLIGANMSIRRDAFNQVQGFHSIDFDDLDLCMRLGDHFSSDAILYEPRAVVFHFVPTERVTWRYFWRRSFFTNFEKIEAFAEMGAAANLRAESQFVRRAITEQLSSESRALLRGDSVALYRMGAMLIGISMAAAGHIFGRIQRSIQPLS